ncbi:hypothetical protein PIB30_105482 [Stylosanthes scabra]|uniref:Uncharacterized protein n=1 Tax=Stylosanthes scabra TaxID=79078 RepID=A0ABU6YXE7_9FABA|nr:hypothetical protein [Stylosanthes scabra]
MHSTRSSQKMKINPRHLTISLNKQEPHVQGEKESSIEDQQENLRKRPTMSMDTLLETHGIHLERDVEPSAENERPTQEKQQNLTESNCPTMIIEAFLKTHGIYVEGEEEHSGENANDAGNIDDDDDDDFSNDEEFISEYEDDVLHGDVNQSMHHDWF